MKIDRLSVIIPCFQEKDNVKRFPSEVLEIFRRYPFDTEYLLVNDGSTDGSSEEINKLASSNPNVKVFNHPGNLGLGACLITAIPHASGDAILTLDADLTFHPREFAKLYEIYDENVDCVAGSPIAGKLEGVLLVRKVLTKGVNLIYRILLGKDVSAVSSIFRLYRASVLKGLELHSQSFQINAEILTLLIQENRVIREVPVTLTNRKFGRSKINFFREIRNHLRLFGRILIWRLGFKER